MRKATLDLLEALTGLAIGLAATLVLLQALHQPLAARELARRPDHACRAGPRAPYLDREIVVLQGVAYVCDGYSGNWRRLSAQAQQQLRAVKTGPLWSNY
jgi:hypothetical protein